MTISAIPTGAAINPIGVNAARTRSEQSRTPTMSIVIPMILVRRTLVTFPAYVRAAIQLEA